jgi:hypothetical protein
MLNTQIDFQAITEAAEIHLRCDFRVELEGDVGTQSQILKV